jgi:hypothetical protein
LAGAAVVAALGIAQPPAEAAVFAGTFDPVDFEGTFKLVLSEECLIGDGWIANGSEGCAGSLESVVTSVTSSPPEGPSFVGSLTFAPPPVSSPSELFGFLFNEGALVGLDTTLIHHQLSSPPTGAEWWIQFSSGGMPDGNHGPDPLGCEPECFEPPCEFCEELVSILQTSGLPSGVFLYAANSNTGGNPTLVATAQYTSIQQIPEPGTLALVFGAMLTGWVMRWRLKPPA